MLKLNEDDRKEFAAAVAGAATRADVRDAIRRVYEDLAGAVAERRPTCSASGRCCRFDEYGHRLFVTTLELAVFVDAFSRFSAKPVLAQASYSTAKLPAISLNVLHAARGRTMEENPGAFPASRTTAKQANESCSFLAFGKCTVHAIRPFGCRMFYCDESATEWQREQYERFHNRLKRLHDELNVPYRYVEWREALSAIGLN